MTANPEPPISDSSSCSVDLPSFGRRDFLKKLAAVCLLLVVVRLLKKPHYLVTVALILLLTSHALEPEAPQGIHG
jgi:hypothetical protein